VTRADDDAKRSFAEERRTVPADNNHTGVAGVEEWRS
jgi:hypothetical protein